MTKMLKFLSVAAMLILSVGVARADSGGDGHAKLGASGPGSPNSLELAAAPQPGANDQVVETAGARVFLDPPAAAYLDDKVLDAEVDPQGKVRFTLVTQSLPRD